MFQASSLEEAVPMEETKLAKHETPYKPLTQTDRSRNMDTDCVVHDRTAEDTQKTLDDGVEEGSEVVLGSTAEVTDSRDNLSLDSRLINTGQTQQPVDEIRKRVLEDLLGDLINGTELTQTRSSHSLEIEADVLLNQSQNTADNINTALLLEETRKTHRAVGDSLKSHEDNTRMAYCLFKQGVTTIVQTLQENVVKGLEISLNLLLATISDMADHDVSNTTLLPDIGVLALRDELSSRLVDSTMKSHSKIGDHLPITRHVHAYVNTNNMRNGIVLEKFILITEGGVLPVGVIVNITNQLSSNVQVLGNVLAVLTEESYPSPPDTKPTSILSTNSSNNMRSELTDVGGAVGFLGDGDGEIHNSADVIMHISTASTTINAEKKQYSMQESISSKREIKLSSSPCWKAS